MTFENIPAELRQPPLWLRYYLKPDPKRPDKKPGKVPTVQWSTPELRKANLRPLDRVLENRRPAEGVQRYIEKSEGFVYIDIDHARNPETGEVDGWAQAVIDELDTYCEISASGAGFHLVCRGTLPEDFHIAPDRVEIYAGNSNKLLAMTGDVYDLRTKIEPRQPQLEALLRRAKAREFNPTAATQAPENVQGPNHWRDVFHTGSELDPTPGRVFIKGILEEGITAIGSLSGVGKTWIGLSISHALLSGQPLFGVFPVLQRANVLYLVPEMGGRKFRERMMKMRISMDGGFFCQTIRDGACNLEDPFLLQAVQEMHPVVILDTAIRFQTGDENTSTDQAQGLGARVFNLINHGAASVICMHHRKKSAGQEETTLENALRGSGDFGAMSDCVWAVEHDRRTKGRGWDEEYTEESKQLTRLLLTCVKPRDMEPADPFRIQGRPHIDQIGDFVVLAPETAVEPAHLAKAGDEKVLELIKAQPSISQRGLIKKSGFGADRVRRITGEAGLVQVNGIWQREGGEAMPF
ncbi:MAG: AAA family ATPase [Terriglobales bacterium]